MKTAKQRARRGLNRSKHGFSVHPGAWNRSIGAIMRHEILEMDGNRPFSELVQQKRSAGTKWDAGTWYQRLILVR